MQIFKYSLGLILSIFIFSGCSSKYQVSFDSNPKGATLICDGKNWGYTPISLYIDKEKLEGKSSLSMDCSANWISGVKKNYTSKIPLDKFPEGVSATVERGNGEGYSQDAQFALQVEQMKAQQTQAAAAIIGANAQQQANFNQSLQNLNNNMQMQQLNNNLMMNNLMPKRYDVYVH
jgi:hypothetical protein